MPYLIALAAGVALGCQVVINSKLGAGLGSALWASLASLLIGAVSLFLIQIVWRAPWPAAGSVTAISLWTWCGGLLGAAYLTGVVVSVGRLGAASTVALVVFGQISTAVLLDHFGFLMTTAHPISAPRVLGGILLLIGVILVTRT